MTTFRVTMPHDNTTTAGFRAWGSGTSAYFSASGLVQLMDYNTINWNTVSVPVTTQTASGFEIWRFNDALQAQYPVYIKVEYGSGGSASKPAIWLTVSAGYPTDGSGSFLGNYTGSNFNFQTSFRDTNAALVSNSTSQVLSQSCFFSGDAPSSSRIQVGLFADTLQGTMLFGIERLKDITGSDNANGVGYYFGRGSTGASFFRSGLVLFSSASGSPPQVESQFTGYFSSTSNTQYNGVIATTLLYPQAGNWQYPLLGVLGYINNDLQNYVLVSQSIYGTQHNYMPLGTGSDAVHPIYTQAHIAMRFE